VLAGISKAVNTVKHIWCIVYTYTKLRSLVNLVTSVSTKIKANLTLEQAIKACSSTLSLTSALVSGRWYTPRPVRFSPGTETRYPLHRKLGEPQSRSELERLISPPALLRSSDGPARSESLYRLNYPNRPCNSNST
jgi:hypothetical protein